MDQPPSGRWTWLGAAAGLAVLLFLAPFAIPILGSLVSIWTPAPLVILYRRRGLADGRRGVALALLLALLAAGMLSSGLAGMFFLFYAALALVLGEAPSLGMSEPKAITLAGFVAAGSMLGLMLGMAWTSGQGLDELWQAQWQEQMEMILGGSGAMGVDKAQLEELRQALYRGGRAMFRLAPALMLGGSLLVAWGNQLLVRRHGPQQAAQVPLNLWRSPEPLVWVLILAGALAWAAEGWPYWAAINVLLVLGVMYFFQGLAVVAYWLQKKNAPRGLRVMLYALLAVEMILAVLVALAGLFDIWFNFRRLENHPSA